MISIRYFRCLMILTFLSLSGCVTPAHKNTWFTDHYAESILVKVFNQGVYEIDGLLLDAKGLEQQVKLQVQGRSIKKLQIETVGNASLLDQAIAIHIGELNNLQTFRINVVGYEKISSEQLLSDRDDKINFSAIDFLTLKPNK